MKKYPLIIFSGFVIGGCTAYHPLPLGTHSDASGDVSHIVVHAADMPLPELSTHRFDPSDGLDMTEVAMLAVANNPQLKIARDGLGISHAQAFAAGLLPDPQLGMTNDYLAGNSSLGTTSAFSVSISYAVNTLLTRSSAKAAGQAAERQTDLNLLWQEWQVVSQARVLFVRNVAQQKLMSLLQQQRGMLAARYENTRQAIGLGEVTADAANLDLTLLQNLETAINSLSRQINTNQHDLNDLLGLTPDAPLQLVGDADIAPLDEAKVAADIAQLAQRRPDLRALEFGYESQEQRFRQSVLAQFPALNIGFNRARDNFATYTQGIGISMSLPVFNGNRGNVAIEQATRQKLHDEYQLRINTAVSEIARILQDQQLLEQQLHNAEVGVTALDLAANNAQAAFDSGSIDSLAYNNLRTASLAKQAEAILIRQNLLEQRVALLTLLGGELPEIAPAGTK
ncbi:MAG: TolC family protein [Gallionella sp.]|nr:TolC family protein [Gallionella sp.]